MKQKSCIVIVAGGTGGHISPGIALAEAASSSGLRVVFLSIPRNRNYPEFQNPAQWRMAWYTAPSLRMNPRALLAFVPDFVRALFQALILLRRERPTALLALGGYPSLPAVVAAFLLRIPFYLCEQNAIPGRVTRALARGARGLFLTFPVKEFDRPGIRVVGNPVRRNLLERSQKFRSRLSGSVRAKTAHRSGAPVVLILGGSQGAVQLNDMMLLLWERYPEFSAKYRWILQTGRDHEKPFLSKLKARVKPALQRRIELFGFDPDIHRYYERADVVVGRAGAGNITEAELFGLPMVLVPYPYAKDGHQKANAQCVASAGAGILIDRTDAEPEELLEALSNLSTPKQRLNMRRQSMALAHPEAGDEIIRAVMG